MTPPLWCAEHEPGSETRVRYGRFFMVNQPRHGLLAKTLAVEHR